MVVRLRVPIKSQILEIQGFAIFLWGFAPRLHHRKLGRLPDFCRAPSAFLPENCSWPPLFRGYQEQFRYVFALGQSQTTFALRTISNTKFQLVTICHQFISLFKKSHTYSLRLGVCDFAPGAFADVTADVDDEDFVGHVDLAFVHVVEHGFGAFCPDFVVTAVAKQTDGDDDVAFKGESLLSFQVLLLELRAAAEGYYFVFADHNITVSLHF